MARTESILLVEDNMAHVELIRRAFEEDAFDIELQVCDNLHDARQSIQSKHPDLVIADLNLPDGNGLELTSASQEDNKYPLILMTSFGDEKIAVGAMKSGAFDYIVKSPETFSSIPKVVDRALREWKNIAAKRQAQQALLHQEHEQREILNTILDGVITIQGRGIILTSNKSAENLFHYGTGELVGEDINRLIPGFYENFQNEYLQHFDISITYRNSDRYGNGIVRELEAQRKNSVFFPMRLSMAELPGSSVDMRRFILSCQDLTQLKEHEEQIRRSQKLDALGKLTGGIAHDYNNLLAIIMGFAELLNSQLAEESKLAIFAQEIQHAAERGARLTKKLLAFSRHKSFDRKILDINALLQDQKLMLEKILTVRIKLVYDLIADPWPVKLDRGDLENAIVNMCINALHAMQGGGQLIIRTSNEYMGAAEARLFHLKPGDYTLLSLTDTGCGMDNSSKERVFDPYFSTKGEHGTGLGLSQVYGFAEASDGAVQVYSELGKGSRFELYFPRVVARDTGDMPSGSKLKSINLTGSENILVVDDEPSIADLAANILSANGYSVFTANDATHAILVLEKQSIDLMVSDVIMPNTDGFQLAKSVQLKYPHIKIQMVSGFSDNRHSQDTNDTMRHNILYKPYSSYTLLRHIRSLLDDGDSSDESLDSVVKLSHVVEEI
ncbi:MAG: response regulator [Thiohalomonadales bacterium]